MKKFYIITNEIKDKNFIVTNQVNSIIEKLGGKVFLASEVALKDLEAIDYILTLGGDGTLIRAASRFYKYNIPLVGINLGNLGYLTEIEQQNLLESIQAIMVGEYIIEERMMLRGQIEGKETIALNDIVITSRNRPSILSFDIKINGQFLHAYKADGVIIASPTGATGYNMSAGGPIVDPTASLLLMTPICAHALHARSIVLAPTDRIEIVLNDKHQGLKQEACIACDGEVLTDFEPGHSLIIEKSNYNIKLVRLNKGSFLETIRIKMEG